MAVEAATKLVKTTGGKIELFYSLNGDKFLTSENPIVAMRSITQTENKINETLLSLEGIIKQEHVKVESSFSYGPLKNKLRDRINETPDMTIVLSKNNFKKVSRWKNSAIKNSKGDILILGKNSTFLTPTDVQLLGSKLISSN